jgi:hypothetical protein
MNSYMSADGHQRYANGNEVEEPDAPPPGELAASPTGTEGLQARWQRLCNRVQELWPRLQVSQSMQIAMTDGALSRVSPESVHRLEVHLRELMEFRTETQNLIGLWVERGQLLESVRGSHALGVNDARLVALRADLQRLSQLSTLIVRAIHSWSRRFGHLVVDNSQAVPGKPKPVCMFVWQGRDCVERVHGDAEALARGEVPALDPIAAAIPGFLAGLGGAEEEQEQEQGLRPGGGDQLGEGFENDLSGLRAGTAPAEAAQGQPLCPLVASTVASQRFAVVDVLHEGPTPPWFKQDVARAGIKALRRRALRQMSPPVVHH